MGGLSIGRPVGRAGSRRVPAGRRPRAAEGANGSPGPAAGGRGRCGQDRARRRDPRGGRHGARLRIDHRHRQGGRGCSEDQFRGGAEGQGRRRAASPRRRGALRRTGAGTEAQVTDLTAQVKTLESAIATAEARRRAAEARLEDVVVRAPFAGRLGTRSVSVGAYSSPGTRITTLDDLSRVRLDFAVPENLLGQLQPGQIVRAASAAYGQQAFEGRVSVIDPRVDPVTRTVRLTAEFPNPDEALKPGMFLSVALTVNARNDAVVIPEEAVVGEGLRHLVYVVKDNVVERRVVRIGQRQEGRVEIVEALQPGETIIVRGVQRVRPGLTVTPKPIP